MQKLSHILCIKPNFYDQYQFESINRSYGVRVQWIHRLKQRFNSILPELPIRRFTGKLYRYLNVDLRAQIMSEEDKQTFADLETEFYPYNMQLQKVLNIDLSYWE